MVEPTGSQHLVRVERTPIGTRVTFDRQGVARFDHSADGDRHVFSVGGRLATVLVPRSAGDQPSLSIDGRPVLGGEAMLPPAEPLPAPAEGGNVAVTGADLTRHQIEERRNGGGSWFYWIGGASILNSLVYAAGLEWGLVIGLGITQLIDGIAIAVSGTVRTPIYAIVIDVIIAGGFMLLGRAARAGRLGWYAFGIVLYAADGLIFVLVQDWLAIALHAFALLGLVSGWRAGRALRRIDRAVLPVAA